MPGLTQEWWDAEIWDHDNLEKQIEIADKNVDILLNESIYLPEAILRSFKEKHENFRKKSDLITWEVQKIKSIFELQRDLWALHYFVKKWFQDAIPQLDFQDRNGIKGQVERIMNDEGLDPYFPQLVVDAERAIRSDWAEPPAVEMYVYEVASNVVSIEQVDWWISDPEAIEFDAIVQQLRNSVWDDYDLNSEIDRIISLKISYAAKVTDIHESVILKPHLK